MGLILKHCVRMRKKHGRTASYSDSSCNPEGIGRRSARVPPIPAIYPINMPNANIIITRQGALNILYPFTF